MNQGLEQQMPSFNLASKILCKVVNVVLRVSFIACGGIFFLSFPYRWLSDWHICAHCNVSNDYHFGC